MVGTRQRVLVTGPAARIARELAARTDNNRVVNFAGDAASIGRYVDVDITRGAAALVARRTCRQRERSRHVAPCDSRGRPIVYTIHGEPRSCRIFVLPHVAAMLVALARS